MSDRGQTTRWGLIGLGAMGRNLALNLMENGVGLETYDADPRQGAALEAEATDGGCRIHASLEALVAALPAPRVILMLTPAGEAVDQVLAQITPLLDSDDVLIDGANSRYRDTMRRSAGMGSGGPSLLDAGFSGGPDGARLGPAVMLGGSMSAASRVSEILSAVAWREDRRVGFAHLGPSGCGHFVKMVHNGIEYVDMQLIAEAWLVMRSLAGLSTRDSAALFREWSAGRLGGYLLSITASILEKVDPETGDPLILKIKDQAHQLGTGRWTAMAALDLGVFAPLFDLAVSMRVHSLSQGQSSPPDEGTPPDPSQVKKLLEALESALFASRIIAFLQGFALLEAGASRYGWELDPLAVTSVWRCGSVIRCELLGSLPAPRTLLDGCTPGWRSLVASTARAALPTPAMSLALSCFDAKGKREMGGALIQAQRDCFGHHGFERTDMEGLFHADWLETEADGEDH